MDNIKRLIAECKKLEFNNKVTFKVPLNDVQDEIDMLNHKQSIIPVVSQQRELLIDFCNIYAEADFESTENTESFVDWFIKVKDN